MFAVGAPLVSRPLALNRLTWHALIASAVPTPAPLFLCPMDGFGETHQQLGFSPRGLQWINHAALLVAGCFQSFVVNFKRLVPTPSPFWRRRPTNGAEHPKEPRIVWGCSHGFFQKRTRLFEQFLNKRLAPSCASTSGTGLTWEAKTEFPAGT
jgi:hypothetical protein